MVGVFDLVSGARCLCCHYFLDNYHLSNHRKEDGFVDGDCMYGDCCDGEEEELGR